MRVLLLGATPFLGSFVADELRRRRHEVGSMGRDPGDAGDAAVSLDGDPSDPAALGRAVASWRPEGLIDLKHDGPEQARAVVQACAGTVKRSVHVSSSIVYGVSPICPVDEETPAVQPDQAGPEAARRLAADAVVLEAAAGGVLPATVIRLAHLYGPRDPMCAEWFFARRVLDGRRRIALPDAGMPICHRGFVQNMAWGVVQALAVPRAAGQVYNLGEEKLYTVAQLAQGVARALNHTWDLYSVPGHLWTTPYAHTSFLELRKARAQLRYKDRMIPRDGLELTLAWLCQNPRGDDWTWPGIDAPFDYGREDELIDRVGARLGV